MLTASKKLWDRFADKGRRRAFRRTHIGNFLALQVFKMRNDRELSQSDLAKLVGSTQPQISDWEASCENVSLRTLHKLADVFDVALSVKFVPYSEMTREALMVPADRHVPAFDDESPYAVGYNFGSVKFEEKPLPRPPRNGAGRAGSYDRRPALAGTGAAAGAVQIG